MQRVATAISTEARALYNDGHSWRKLRAFGGVAEDPTDRTCSLQRAEDSAETSEGVVGGVTTPADVHYVLQRTRSLERRATA
jgi:hypothetical protein